MVPLDVYVVPKILKMQLRSDFWIVSLFSNELHMMNGRFLVMNNAYPKNGAIYV